MNNAGQYLFSKKKSFFLCLVLSMCFTIGSVEAQTAFLEIDDIRDGWESTYGSIGSMKLSYCDRLIAFKPPPDEPNAPTPVRIMHVQRLEKHEQYHLKASMSEEGFNRLEDTLMFAFDGESSTRYSGASHDGQIMRGIQTGASSNTNALKDYMLLNGMRFRHRDEDIPVFRHYVGQSNAKVLPDLESVAGVPCHVVEIKGENGSIKIWTAHDKGFLPLKFERISTNPVRGDLFEQRVVQEIALVETDVGAFWYPKKARWILHERDGQESTNEINVSEFIPNAHMTQADFRVDFPPGTRIYDSIAGIQYRTGQIPDVDLQELRQTTALETDLNQAVGGANGALGLGTAEMEIPAIAATADQNDQDSLMANGTVVAQASGAGFRRILCIALTGLGSVLLLMGIWSLRVSRRSLAQGGR